MNRRPAATFLALAAIAAAEPARAALGEPASSVDTDQRRLGAAHRQRDARGTHAVEQLRSDARTVREYVSPSGIVFAVCWDGITPPDLSVLGAYAAPYRRGMAAQGAPRARVRRVESGGAVVETWGHMRDVHGRAYVPDLVPTGVGLDEIR
jgi:hypothetical protein